MYLGRSIGVCPLKEWQNTVKEPHALAPAWGLHLLLMWTHEKMRSGEKETWSVASHIL